MLVFYSGEYNRAYTPTLVNGRRVSLCEKAREEIVIFAIRAHTPIVSRNAETVALIVMRIEKQEGKKEKVRF